MKKSITIAGVVVALVIGLAGGYFWGYAKGGAAVTASYAPKIAQVSALFPVPQDVRALSGKITSIGSASITLAASPLSPNPFNDGFIVNRTVMVDDATVFTSSRQKTPAEMSVPQAVVATPTKPGVPPVPLPPPSPFITTSSTFSNLQVGDTVTVISDNDIAKAATFTATSIQDQK